MSTAHSMPSGIPPCKGQRFRKDQIPEFRGLLAEGKPVVGAAEALDPIEVRLALRVVPPDIARGAVAPEGTVGRSHDIHRILAELFVEFRVLFADCEGFARIGPLEAFGFGPCEGLVPVPVAVREVEENELLLDDFRADGRILVADLANVVVVGGVGPRGIDGLLPVAALLDLDLEDMDSSALRRFDVRELHLERLEEAAEGAVVECLLEAGAADLLLVRNLAAAFHLTNSHGRILAHNLFRICVYLKTPTPVGIAGGRLNELTDTIILLNGIYVNCENGPVIELI